MTHGDAALQLVQGPDGRGGATSSMKRARGATRRRRVREEILSREIHVSSARQSVNTRAEKPRGLLARIRVDTHINLRGTVPLCWESPLRPTLSLLL